MHVVGRVSFSIGLVKCKALTLPYGVVYFANNTLIFDHPYFSALEAKKMKKSFGKWIEERVETENDFIWETERLRHFFCADTIYDDFWEDASVTEEMMVKDDYDELYPIWVQYVKEFKPLDYDDQAIQDRIDEDNAEMQTRSMEMGWGGSFTSNSRGQRTYFPYDDY